MTNFQGVDRFSFWCVAGLVVFGMSCGSNDSSENNAAQNNVGPNNGGGTKTSRVVTTGIEFSFATAKAANLNGDLLLAGDTAGGITVARLTADLEPVWAVELADVAILTSLKVDTQGRIILVSSSYGVPSKLVRLNADGTLDRAIAAAGQSFSDAEPLEDGGLMLSDSTRLNADLEIVSHGNTGGQKVARVADGFVFLSASDLGLGGRKSGAMVRRTDDSGMLVWQSFATPSAANYTPIGIRELPDGRILAAVSGDTNPGHALVTALFDADGTFLEIQQPALQILYDSGETAPLQFGSGMQMVAAGDTTYVSFVANSGALGIDARTQISAQLDADGVMTGGLFFGGGMAVLGDSIAIANHVGQVHLTNHMKSNCVDSPVVTNNAPEAESEFKTAAEFMLEPKSYTVEAFSPSLTAVNLTISEQCLLDYTP